MITSLAHPFSSIKRLLFFLPSCTLFFLKVFLSQTVSPALVVVQRLFALAEWLNGRKLVKAKMTMALNLRLEIYVFMNLIYY
jgi:hypothetical protein